MTRVACVVLAPAGPPRGHRTSAVRPVQPAVRRGLPDPLHGLRFHDLRHTCASLLIGLNENPKAIQAYLGHSSIQVTYDRYGHLLPGTEDKLNAALDALADAVPAPTAAVLALYAHAS